MGVAELKTAFDEVGAPHFTAERAFLEYENANDIQWQRLTFRVIKAADGSVSEVKSDRIPPGGDIMEAARAVARSLVDGMGGQAS